MGMRTQQVRLEGPLSYLPTANLLVRREIWRQLGGFAPLTFGEDVDFCHRLLARQHRILYLPQGIVYHDYRTKWWPFLRIRASYASAEAALLKRHPEQRRVLLLPPEQALFAGMTIGGIWNVGAQFIAPVTRDVDGDGRNGYGRAHNANRHGRNELRPYIMGASILTLLWSIQALAQGAGTRDTNWAVGGAAGNIAGTSSIYISYMPAFDALLYIADLADKSDPAAGAVAGVYPMRYCDWRRLRTLAPRNETCCLYDLLPAG